MLHQQQMIDNMEVCNNSLVNKNLQSPMDGYSSSVQQLQSHSATYTNMLPSSVHLTSPNSSTSAPSATNKKRSNSNSSKSQLANESSGSANSASSNFDIKRPQQQMPLPNNSNLSVKPLMAFNSNPTCSSCHLSIDDKYIFNIMNTYWHEECLTCSQCGKLLQQTCFFKNMQLFCKDDYFKQFGTRCNCCLEPISPNELVMRISNNQQTQQQHQSAPRSNGNENSNESNKVVHFHLNCFKCLICDRILKKGDEFVYRNENIYCKYDFERILAQPNLFASHGQKAPHQKPPPQMKNGGEFAPNGGFNHVPSHVSFSRSPALSSSSSSSSTSSMSSSSSKQSASLYPPPMSMMAAAHPSGVLANPATMGIDIYAQSQMGAPMMGEPFPGQSFPPSMNNLLFSPHHDPHTAHYMMQQPQMHQPLLGQANNQLAIMTNVSSTTPSSGINSSNTSGLNNNSNSSFASTQSDDEDSLDEDSVGNANNSINGSDVDKIRMASRPAGTRKSAHRRITKRPRTILNAVQRYDFKEAFKMSPKPCRKVREHLADKTGLSVRVVQVWFQNERAKVKKMLRRQQQQQQLQAQQMNGGCVMNGNVKTGGKRSKSKSDAKKSPAKKSKDGALKSKKGGSKKGQIKTENGEAGGENALDGNFLKSGENETDGNNGEEESDDDDLDDSFENDSDDSDVDGEDDEEDEEDEDGSLVENPGFSDEDVENKMNFQGKIDDDTKSTKAPYKRKKPETKVNNTTANLASAGNPSLSYHQSDMTRFLNQPSSMGYIDNKDAMLGQDMASNNNAKMMSTSFSNSLEIIGNVGNVLFDDMNNPSSHQAYMDTTTGSSSSSYYDNILKPSSSNNSQLTPTSSSGYGSSIASVPETIGLKNCSSSDSSQQSLQSNPLDRLYSMQNYFCSS